MSYTGSFNYPETLEFFIKDDILFCRFTCPRCNSTQERVVDLQVFTQGLEISCAATVCCGKDPQRPGYQFDMRPKWHESCLGLSDRPLSSD